MPAAPLENAEAWARVASCLDPTREPRAIYDDLSKVLDHADYPSELRLENGPYSEETVASVLAAHPVLAEFYSAETMLDIANTFQGDSSYIAAAANPSLPVKNYFTWAGDTYLNNVRFRETGDNLFWRCNPMASSNEALAELQRLIGSIARPDYVPVLLHRWLKNLESYFLVTLKMEESYPLLREACEAVTGRPDMLSQNDLFFGYAMGRFYLAEILGNTIRIRLRSGQGEFDSIAALIHDLEQVRSRLGGPPLPNPFDRLL